MAMLDDRQALLNWIDEDRHRLIGFLQRFIRAKSPNPPGDTREAAACIRNFLDEEALAYRVIDPQETMPNILGSFQGNAPGKHLVLNGHIDVFPVGDAEGWTKDPWGGELADGRIYGRGACDMKAGTTASIFTYAYLHRLRDRLKGRLTLTAVSDEETFGPWGARYLMKEHAQEVHGDCLLNGEPSSPYTVRFGEKGAFWVRVTIVTPGAHGAYTHQSESATKIAARLIGDLEALTELRPTPPDNIARAVEGGGGAMDRAMGSGAGDIVSKITVNIGTVQGGLKVNMVPGICKLEVDVRLPLGIERDRVRTGLEKILEDYRGVKVEEINYNAPSYCDPHGEMAEIIRDNVLKLRDFKPTPIVSLGGTDARLWRYEGIPAYVYGPFPHGMGSYDEHVEVEEFLHVVRTHVLSAYDYLATG
jgi:succinyl-diaminopimelate desuccinylase